MIRKTKVLLLDIETSPILANVWGAYDQNVSHSQVVKDWHILSWAAKWLDDPVSKIIYKDQRRNKPIGDDAAMMRRLWSLLDEADVIVTHNGKRFDRRKIHAVFLRLGFKPYSPVKHVDTCLLARRIFGFTFNSLEHLSSVLDLKYKKLKHGKFPGFELWTQCLLGNKEAWREMEKYNKHDVLALEELYKRLSAWDSTSFLVHEDTIVCKCGSEDIQRRGFAYTGAGKFQKYVCMSCGHWSRDTKRLRNVSRTGAR